MVAKPSETTILQTYSFDDLLDLIREKARIEAEEQRELVRRHLSSLSQTLTGTATKSAPAASKIPVRRGRPKKDAAESFPESKGAQDGQKKTPLGKLVQQVLGKEPMGIRDIMQALYEIGYQSKSKEPRRILYLELNKQVENKTVKKMGRGMYAKR